MASLHRCDSFDALVADLAPLVVRRLTEVAIAHGAAVLVCAGGTTPGELYAEMSVISAPWNRITVTASDERWVPPTGEASNEHLVRTTLLKGPAAAAAYVPLRTEDPTPEEGVFAVETAVAALPRPFAVTLIGMGTDLHIASLCPGAEGLEEAMDVTRPDLVHAIRAKSGVGSNVRMTLTLRALLESEAIFLVIRGEAKLQAYQAALAGEDVMAAPVRGVLQQAITPVHVYWSP